MDRLPDSGYMLDQLMSGTVDSIYFKDLHSRLIMCNQACARKRGKSTPQEVIGELDSDVFSKEHAEKAFADEQRIIATGEPLKGVEEKETWPDGHITWCFTTKMPLRDNNGNIVGIFGISRDITAHKQAELKAQQYAEEVRAIKESMEDDARMAGKLQRSFFLSEFPVIPVDVDPSESCIEFLHHLHKSSLVGGDYCHVRRLSDTKVSILLCDIRGAGARAALGASLIRGIMQDLDRMAEDPSDYVSRLNEQLYPLLHRDRLLLDVTACYVVIDCATGVAKVASAGHPLPLHFRNGQPAKWLFENLVLRGPALAAEPHAKFRTINCRLQPDDTVVLFTDGLFSVRNGAGEPFCEKRLLNTAQGLASRSLGRIFRGLENKALEFSRDNHFTDDVSIIGFRLRRLL